MAGTDSVARVTVAARPDEKTEEKILAFVKEHGCVTAVYTIDENIIGGLIIQIGDTIYDGSVRGKLDNIKRAL